jgi:hypothetical protein
MFSILNPVTFLTSCTMIQIDRIDLLYYVNSSRVNVKEETRINATSEEVVEWENQIQSSSGIVIYSVIAVARSSFPISCPAELYLGNLLSYTRNEPLWISTHDSVLQ